MISAEDLELLQQSLPTMSERERQKFITIKRVSERSNPEKRES
jgi:hypothetical protein